ncbi:MAG TPA: carbonate dehydratase [Rhodospirillaceae bacterium]|nr:carbonate dehydratase [Rhodospirillaceae bacterium]
MAQLFPERLIDGYRNFRENRLPLENNRLKLLANHGQRPKIMLIGCCDSRVSPEVIFDTAPGEIFVVRNVANLVPPFEQAGEYHGTSAALEFAVIALKVKHIVVMGHGRCGGVHAALNESDPLSHSDFIGQWMSIMDNLAAEVRNDVNVPEALKAKELEHRAVQLSLQNLLSFPWVRSAHDAGELSLHGAWFDVSEGELHILNSKDEKFYSV